MEHDIPFGNSNRGNGTTFLDFPLFLGIFQWDEPTKRVPFTAETEIPEILTKWKAPLITCVLTICHVKLTRSTSLEQKRFDLRSLSPALRNLWLLLLYKHFFKSFMNISKPRAYRQQFTVDLCFTLGRRWV